MKSKSCLRHLIYILFSFLLLTPTLASAFSDGARTYWKNLAGANAVTVWPIFMDGNTNPLDPAFDIDPQADFSATVAILGYHKVFPLFGRSATASILLPVGSIDASFTAGPLGTHQSTNGYGDPMLQLDTNLIGGPALMSLADVVRYEPKFTLDLLTSLSIPIGEYHSDKPLNMGQNRWFGRIGFPAMLTFGPWVPGQRTTLEVLPAVWLFGDNDDAVNPSTGATGQTKKNDPLLQLETHVTRDLTETLWGSIDSLWLWGGRPEISGVTGDLVNSWGIGFTLGYKVTDNLSVNASYMSTVGDKGSKDLRVSDFMVMLNYGWHPLVEGMNRLKAH
ncbi:transporter [Geomonas sp.]|uniref:transporter n=1 Tax=Geomonas sp. TaxID=2651584 RepID=UPI002B47157B|nr:transporter [Geomonas sp.]HJV36014.1 transporter [Geomonas sp.]